MEQPELVMKFLTVLGAPLTQVIVHPTDFCTPPVNKLKTTTPTPHKNGSYGIKVGVRMA